MKKVVDGKLLQGMNGQIAINMSFGREHLQDVLLV